MKLVFLFGRPAVGKLTIARELSARTGGRLFHNHLTVNLVLSVYEFGSPGFIELRGRIWMDVFRRAIADRIPLLIFTFNPESTVPQDFVDGLFSEYEAAGGTVTSVELVAEERDIEARLGSTSRMVGGKTLRLERYRVLSRAGAFDTPVVPKPDLTLNTSQLAPPEAVAKILSLL